MKDNIKLYFTYYIVKMLHTTSLRFSYIRPLKKSILNTRSRRRNASLISCLTLPLGSHAWHTYSSILILLAASLQSIHAQVGIGQWRTHLPYQNANKVMLTDDKAFCSTTGGLFYYNLEDNSVQTISKADGLSDNGVVAMQWSEENGLAVVAYENANVDIISGNDIINVPDIMNKQLPGNKAVNHIYFIDRKAYLSCGFGIVVLDLENIEITDTYYIGDNGEKLAVNQLTSDDTYFYAATESGIKRARMDNAFLIDYHSWENLEELPDPTGEYTAIEQFNDRLFVVHHDAVSDEDELLYYNGTWNIYPLSENQCNELHVSGNELIITGKEKVSIMSENFLIVKEYQGGAPKSTAVDETGTLWIADYGRGLVRVSAGEEKNIQPNGPYSTIAYRMEDKRGKLYSVSGGVTPIYNNVFRPGILMQFNKERWRSSINYDFQDLISIAVDPRDENHVFAASWGYGLVEYKDGEPVEVYNETNSSLQNAVPGQNVVRIGGVTYDDDNNLWMTNTAVQEPISVLKNDGTWKSFRAGGKLSSFAALGEIIYTEYGHLWGIIPKGNGLFAINFNGTIDNEEDDEYKLVSVKDENGKVITNEVFSIAEDHDGNIWLGTNQGILVFYSPERLFTQGSVFAREICIPRDDGTDYCDPLLKTEKVTSIEVDGANRKWLGTADGGAFLVSSNGLNQLYYFNTTNSPILSNSILDICVEGVSGEVFFGTEKGIISFRGEATEGDDIYSDVVVFPNPIRSDYDGPIAIRGLVAETTVKITDISGNLVREIESDGGQAIWDGKDFRGKRVATGPSLVFLANSDANRAAVTKLMVIH